MTLVSADADASLATAMSALDAGRLVVIPGGTQYALAADALVEEAVERVFSAKRRAADRPLPVCIGGVEDVRHIAQLTPLARQLADRFWPGPVALVLSAKSWAPDVLTAGGDAIAVCVPQQPFAVKLAREFGPFTLAGAHIDGRTRSRTAVQARESLGAEVEFYIDGGELPGLATTVIDARGTQAKVLRVGVVAASEFAADADA